jgi:sorting nexin-29
LDVDITEAEVAEVLSKIRNNRAADASGRVAELFTKATVERELDGRSHTAFVLAPGLARVLNCIFSSGRFPEAEAVGMIVPIYKGKLEKLKCTNHRGVTIITIMAKIYAMVLNARIMAWTEGEGVRAVDQAGFRSGRRTTDHIFLLQHLIDKYRSKRKSLFACFIDLSKAFDTINRDRLWSRLDKIGIRGRMLQALKSYYETVRECVKTAAGLTGAFDSRLGVKQGCPLSPTLFGLYIDELEPCLRSAVANTMVKVGRTRLPLMLYADDIVLLAESPAELQRLLNALGSFCDRQELTANLDKSAAVVFERRRQSTPVAVHLQGAPMPVRDSYVYLGICFHKKKGAMAGADALVESAKKAVFALERVAFLNEIADIETLCDMFDTLITPILTYGCEVWGPWTGFSDYTAPVERLHLGFLKRICGLRPSVDSKIVFMETNRTPLVEVIWGRVANFWRRLHTLEGQRREGEPMRDAGRENRELTNVSDRSCWSQRVLKGFNNLTLNGDEASQVRVRLKFADKWKAACGEAGQAAGDERDFYSQGRVEEGERFRSYMRWFCDSAIGTGQGPVIKEGGLSKELLRFRTGCHGLNIVKGAWTGVPRNQRLCKCCNMGVVEDEAHFILECPLYHSTRSQCGKGANFETLFEKVAVKASDGSLTILIDDTAAIMRQVFGTRKRLLLAKFIRACFQDREVRLNPPS